MTGTLRVHNEDIMFNRDTVMMALDWLIREYNCTIDGVEYEKKETIYIITGWEIPPGNINLEVETIVPGVVSIKII